MGAPHRRGAVRRRPLPPAHALRARSPVDAPSRPHPSRGHWPRARVPRRRGGRDRRGHAREDGDHAVDAGRDGAGGGSCPVRRRASRGRRGAGRGHRVRCAVADPGRLRGPRADLHDRGGPRARGREDPRRSQARQRLQGGPPLIRRPVKITLDREEVFYAHRGRHPVKMRIRTGVKKDGEITAVHYQSWLDGGAYASYGIATTYYTGALLTVTYRIPAYKFDGVRVYTNKPPCGPKRGHGTTQPRYGFECQIDKIADRKSTRLNSSHVAISYAV